MSSYKTISQDIQLEITPIKKSRFIAYAFYVENEQSILTKINTLKITYSDANHHCWAYSLFDNNQFRYNDAGEPTGSAGKPILSHIQGKELTNILVVIIRYFGGTKLGVGGLIRAYGRATKEVLETTTIIDVKSQCKLCIKYQYDQTNNVAIVLNHYNAVVLEEKYSDFITLIIKINASDKSYFIAELANLTKDSVKIEML